MTEANSNRGGDEETTISDRENEFMDLIEFNVPISQPKGSINICKLSKHRRLQQRRYREVRKMLRTLCKQSSEFKTSNNMQILPYNHNIILPTDSTFVNTSNSDLLFSIPSSFSFTNVTNTSSASLSPSLHISDHNYASNVDTNYQTGIIILCLFINMLTSFVRRFL